MSQPATPETTTIGFLGLGIMGQAMARNLDNAGFKLTVYNRDDTKSRQFVDSCSPNVCIASTPAELVAKSDITLAMLSDPEAVRSVAVGPTGVLAGIVPGKAYIDVSTVDADTARWMNECVHEKGGRFLEAPVSGSKGPAEQGQLVRCFSCLLCCYGVKIQFAKLNLSIMRTLHI
jgi:glyoxylate/succinic semialdehyde reductase